jgi:hypothetical protein
MKAIFPGLVAVESNPSQVDGDAAHSDSKGAAKGFDTLLALVAAQASQAATPVKPLAPSVGLQAALFEAPVDVQKQTAAAQTVALPTAPTLPAQQLPAGFAATPAPASPSALLPNAEDTATQVSAAVPTTNVIAAAPAVPSAPVVVLPEASAPALATPVVPEAVAPLLTPAAQPSTAAAVLDAPAASSEPLAQQTAPVAAPAQGQPILEQSAQPPPASPSAVAKDEKPTAKSAGAKGEPSRIAVRATAENAYRVASTRTATQEGDKPDARSLYTRKGERLRSAATETVESTSKLAELVPGNAPLVVQPTVQVLATSPVSQSGPAARATAIESVSGPSLPASNVQATLPVLSSDALASQDEAPAASFSLDLGEAAAAKTSRLPDLAHAADPETGARVTRIDYFSVASSTAPSEQDKPAVQQVTAQPTQDLAVQQVSAQPAPSETAPKVAVQVLPENQVQVTPSAQPAQDTTLVAAQVAQSPATVKSAQPAQEKLAAPTLRVPAQTQESAAAVKAAPEPVRTNPVAKDAPELSAAQLPTEPSEGVRGPETKNDARAELTADTSEPATDERASADDANTQPDNQGFGQPSQHAARAAVAFEATDVHGIRGLDAVVASLLRAGSDTAASTPAATASGPMMPALSQVQTEKSVATKSSEKLASVTEAARQDSLQREEERRVLREVSTVEQVPHHTWLETQQHQAEPLAAAAAEAVPVSQPVVLPDPDAAAMGKIARGEGVNGASISIEHPELGSIDVVVQSEKGRVDVRAVLDTPRAAAVLRAHESALRYGVQQAGMTFGALRVRSRNGETEPNKGQGSVKRRRSKEWEA